MLEGNFNSSPQISELDYEPLTVQSSMEFGHHIEPIMLLHTMLCGCVRKCLFNKITILCNQGKLGKVTKCRSKGDKAFKRGQIIHYTGYKPKFVQTKVLIHGVLVSVGIFLHLDMFGRHSVVSAS